MRLIHQVDYSDLSDEKVSELSLVINGKKSIVRIMIYTES